jgi:hypothetical protein
MVLDALKKRLHDVDNIKGGKWIKELPNALWGASYSTYQANRVVALLPGLWLRSYSTHRRDVGIPGSRTIRQRNLRRRRVDIDSLEEARYATLVQSARYLEGIRRYHDPTSRNAPSTLVILSFIISKTRTDYTSSSHHGKVPSQSPR